MKFTGKEILGMVHLSGPSVVERALEEIEIYQKQGLYGVIIENYHGSVNDIIYVLKKIDRKKITLKIGINVLPNEIEKAYEIATEYNVDFIQFDFISGIYEPNIQLDEFKYLELRQEYPDIFILGGVHPKYYRPVKGSILLNDLIKASELCDGIVVTGKATGIETEKDRIILFKSIIILNHLNKPLIIGAGLNTNNVVDQLSCADGGIVGSAFKPNGRTTKMVDEQLVKEFMYLLEDEQEKANT